MCHSMEDFIVSYFCKKKKKKKRKKKSTENINSVLFVMISTWMTFLTTDADFSCTARPACVLIS